MVIKNEVNSQAELFQADWQTHRQNTGEQEMKGRLELCLAHKRSSGGFSYPDVNKHGVHK